MEAACIAGFVCIPVIAYCFIVTGLVVAMALLYEGRAQFKEDDRVRKERQAKLDKLKRKKDGK